MKLAPLASIPVNMKFALFTNSSQGPMSRFYWFFVYLANPFWIHLCYFISVSFLGFVVLGFMKPKNPTLTPQNLDLFFMSVSATTISSMGTIEMEVFSNAQLLILTLLMLVGGEVFLSMLGLQFMNTKLRKPKSTQRDQLDSICIDCSCPNPKNNAQIEFESAKLEPESENLKYNTSRYLVFMVLSYYILIHIVGSISTLLYISFVSSARDVLKNKGIELWTFSVFTTVSSFGNCGFIPTNENLLVFKKNSGLLLLILPQVLIGNTLFPPCLRLLLCILRRITRKVEFDYMLKNPRDIGYDYLLPSAHSLLLVLTVLGFILVQFILFCCLDWNSEGLRGLNFYQKFVASLFQSTNSRHAGESVVDISTLTSAILVVYVFMMYLPPYTSFLPIEDDKCCSKTKQNGKRRREFLKSLNLSQLSYLVIFIVLICITERKKMVNDPLNFNVLNIVVEVISAYGNVGFSTGYSCKRLLEPDGNCKDAWYGFSGRWSNKGKVILIVVMFFGRLKKFHFHGGKGWNLS